MSDMERQDYIDQINDLKAANKRLLDMIDILKQTLDSVTASNKRNEELVIKLTAQIDQLQKMIKNLEDKNQRHNKHTFGKSSLKKNKRAEEKQSREEEKEDYDGNHDNGAQASENTDNQIDQTKVKSEHLDGERAKRENYTKILLKVGSFLNIDETWCRIRIKIKGDGTKLGHYFKKYIWILINKMEQVAYFLYDNDENDSRGYRPISSFLSGFKGTIASDANTVYKQLCLEHPDIEHCLCWAHVRAKFQYALEISKEEDAEWMGRIADIPQGW